jgi:hypothetical protein
MAKMIRVEPSGASYRLPADTDLDQLRMRICATHNEGRSAEVVVELQDNPLTRGFLVLNPDLPAFFLVEMPEGGLTLDAALGADT